MKEVVFLIIISIIILGFLSSDIIPLFRSSMDVIGTVAEKEYEGQKIKSNVLLPLEKDSVVGSDVIGVIRYFSDDDTVTVKIIMGEETEIYTNNSYNATDFTIPYDMIFNSSYEYDEQKLLKAIYTKN
ncbi:hypothetical protein [Sporosalibacterium faouarense]|uniref:hypothetical protein n=1 Tax=Sporosalibacterium faouarense TaxID=516123 RepID=UPI00141C17F0|nr:hypothetical protein [Sporosalibacterium faouarense]MTI48729.1 hypothetical protein [Bacillota bacterium]